MTQPPGFLILNFSIFLFILHYIPKQPISIKNFVATLRRFTKPKSDMISGLFTPCIVSFVLIISASYRLGLSVSRLYDLVLINGLTVTELSRSKIFFYPDLPASK